LKINFYGFTVFRKLENYLLMIFVLKTDVILQLKYLGKNVNFTKTKIIANRE